MIPRPSTPRIWVIAFALVLALSGCATDSTSDSASGGTVVAPDGQTRLVYEPPEIRVPAGNVAGESLAEPGRPLGVADFRGQVVVLNVWGSWCGPCRGEADDLERVATATAPAGVAFLGINVRDARAAARDFLTNFEVSYPSLYDPAGRSLLGLRGVPRNVVPATIVLDREHRVAAVFLAAVLDSDLLPVVARIAAEPPARPR